MRRFVLYLGDNSEIRYRLCTEPEHLKFMKNGKLFDYSDKLLLDSEAVLLHRVQATTDFGDVKKGDFGGFVQGEHNLQRTNSTEEAAWIYDEAVVYGNAFVGFNGKVRGTSVVHSDASPLKGNGAMIINGSELIGNSHVEGRVVLTQGTKLVDSSIINSGEKMGLILVKTGREYKNCMFKDVDVNHISPRPLPDVPIDESDYDDRFDFGC